MLNGYITYNELCILTGYNKHILDKLLTLGLNQHELSCDCEVRSLKEQVFNLEEVVKWFQLHIY